MTAALIAAGLLTVAVAVGVVWLRPAVGRWVAQADAVAAQVARYASEAAAARARAENMRHAIEIGGPRPLLGQHRAPDYADEFYRVGS